METTAMETLRNLNTMKNFNNQDNMKMILEEHLTAINENTTEIQVLFDYLQEVERKVDQMNQRLDHVQMIHSLPAKPITIIPLNHQEKEVFLHLYTEATPQTVDEIAEKAGLSPALVIECLSSFGPKGVPLQRFCSNGQFFFALEKQFKERQAKENLVNVSLENFM